MGGCHRFNNGLEASIGLGWGFNFIGFAGLERLEDLLPEDLPGLVEALESLLADGAKYFADFERQRVINFG